jgi:hypothetical protein
MQICFLCDRAPHHPNVQAHSASRIGVFRTATNASFYENVNSSVAATVITLRADPPPERQRRDLTKIVSSRSKISKQMEQVSSSNISFRLSRVISSVKVQNQKVLRIGFFNAIEKRKK